MSTNSQLFLLLLYIILISILQLGYGVNSENTISNQFSIKEATINDIQIAFKQNRLTSRKLVEFYLTQIHRLDPLLRGVIEVNPDALYLADKADQERKANPVGSLPNLHGIPILLKDNIATKDKLNTTAGSYALLGSVVAKDAGVVVKLRKSGAIILGKASMSEWAGFRSSLSPPGFCARSAQGKNPYVLSASPCGSSSGSAITVAANLATVSLGSETDGSIICPSAVNSVVGIKPTVGLTSRAGVVPLSHRQDTIGPIGRTVADAVYVLDVIAGFDPDDAATKAASKYIPSGGYKQFLKVNGLKGKRLGIIRNPFFNFQNDNGFFLTQTFQNHLQTLRGGGAKIIDDLQIENINDILNAQIEIFALYAEFKIDLTAYLKQLVSSPVRSLADIIAFNNKFSKLEKTKEYGQDDIETAESFTRKQLTDGLKSSVSKLNKLSREGIEKIMKKNKLDAMVAPLIGPAGSEFRRVLAIGGYPGITVPAGYEKKGVPFGICFGGLQGTEPKLIEISYSFEQATKIRKPPSFKP